MKYKRLADKLLHTEYSNPFSDIKNVLSTPVSKMQKEFVPTKVFWSLFNNQNEIVIGTRGSGKTILFRMMAYSMLKKLDNVFAQRIIQEKRFFALYVPMEYDFVECITNYKLSKIEQDQWFIFGTNCLIIRSFIEELKSIVEDYPLQERIELDYSLSAELGHMWNIEDRMRKTDLDELRIVVDNLFSQQDFYSPVSSDIPAVFKNTICGVLETVTNIVFRLLKLKEAPTWIICIDEAEFLQEQHINILSRKMRANMEHVVIKIADLPYFHSLSNPALADKNNKREKAEVGNDFIKTVLINTDDNDFKQLTDSLCRVRLQNYFDDSEKITLQRFLGKIGQRDNYIDYYRNEFGLSISTEQIDSEVKGLISPNRLKTMEKENRTKEVNDQSIYKKLRPIYYVRRMREKKKGNYKVSWFAGAMMVRKMAQGNPRLFLRIMGQLFNAALERELTPENQCEAIETFTKKYRSETLSLERCGDEVSRHLEYIGAALKENVHSGYLKESGNSFKLKGIDFSSENEWLVMAIAYSRIFVENLEEVDVLSESTLFSISNAYAVEFWLPMRKSTFNSSPTINLANNSSVSNRHTVIKTKESSIDASE